MIRAVLDVNVFISATFSSHGFPRRIVSAWQQGLFTLLYSEEMAREVESKLQTLQDTGRLRHLSAAETRAILEVMRAEAELVRPIWIEPVTGDPEDDHVLATTGAGAAEYLVTGDKLLLSLADHAGAKIISPRDFVTILNAG